MTSNDALTTAVLRLCGHVAPWTPPRWAAATASGRTRAEEAYDLVQRMAELAADAEGQPRRTVPRLTSEVTLADQLRVVAGDLVAAGPPAEVLAQAAALVDDTHRRLAR